MREQEQLPVLPETPVQTATPETQEAQEPAEAQVVRVTPEQTETLVVRVIVEPAGAQVAPVMRGPTETRVLRALRARGRRGVAQPPTHGQTKTGQTATLETQVPQALEPRMGERPRLAGPAKTA